MKTQITFDDFAKLDMRVGKIVGAEMVEGSMKLVQLTVELGEEVGARTIYAGIKEWYAPETLVGRKLAFVVNLAPKVFKIAGKEYISNGMLVAAGADRAYLYNFDEGVPTGAILR